MVWLIEQCGAILVKGVVISLSTFKPLGWFVIGFLFGLRQQSWSQESVYPLHYVTLCGYTVFHLLAFRDYSKESTIGGCDVSFGVFPSALTELPFDLKFSRKLSRSQLALPQRLISSHLYRPAASLCDLFG